jgi:tetratricopeptide (TPR) repeat protein
MKLRLARVGLALAIVATPALAFATWGWPSSDTNAQAPGDLIAPVRWGAQPWIGLNPGQAQNVLGQIDALAARPNPPASLLAARAVVLRVLQRYDDAQATLARATARDPHVLDDPDVALTAGYLAARHGHWAEAFTLGRSALPRVLGNDDARADLAVELSRWSMARGPSGVADAIAVLREATFVSSRPMLRATLALAYARANRAEEAREVAHGGQLPTPYETVADARRGGLLNAEGDAALGVALLLAGRGREAVEPLTRAAASSPAPWRASLNEALAQARRSPSRGNEPANGPAAPLDFRIQ